MHDPRSFWNSLARRFGRRRKGLEAIGIPTGSYINNYLDYVTRKAIHNACEKINISEAIVLDLGCGIGRVTEIFADRARFVLGLDISEEMIRIAKERTQNCRGARCNIQYLVASSYAMPLRTEAFDIVNCVAVLQHIEDNRLFDQSIQEISRVLKKQAYAILIEFIPTKTDHNDVTQLEYTTFTRPLAFILSLLKTNELTPIWKQGVTTYILVEFIARASRAIRRDRQQKLELFRPRETKFTMLRLTSDTVLISTALLLVAVDNLISRTGPAFFFKCSKYKAFLLQKK